jgi:hypothetical protein
MLNYITLLAACWLMFSALVVTAKGNFISKMFFKVVPFFLGLACLGAAVKNLGWM